MGLEYIVQPQVFLGGLTALGPGIQGLTENYPLLTTYNYWTSTASVDTSVFPIPGTWSIYDNPNNSASFIVTVGGVVQSPTEYTINPTLRTITFNTAVSADIEVAVTQLATAAPSSQSFDYTQSVDANLTNLTAGDIIADSLVVTNLTALSSVLDVTNIQFYEMSGFSITGDLNITTTTTTLDLVATNATVTNLTADAGQVSLENIDADVAVIVSETVTDSQITNLSATNISEVATAVVATAVVTDLTATNILNTNLTADNVTVNALSANTSHITTPILSTDNSTQVATTNFVRLFGGFQNMAVYTSGTGTVDLSSLGEGIEKIKVTVVGGGGGGGGTSATASHYGNGGGSGGVVVSYIDRVPGVETVTYSVGSGGAGGTVNAAGSTGTSSTLSYDTVSINAGPGTGGAASGTSNGQGVGGTATGGTFNLNGFSGQTGGVAAGNNPVQGTGGNTPLGFGRGGVTSAITSNGLPGEGYGSGGSGGQNVGTATSRAGGAGAGGIIIIEY